MVQLAVLVAALMQSPAMPLRIGDVARQLTDADVTALEMVIPSGSTPWLLSGEYTSIGLAQYIEAFMPPTVETQVLRRGTIISADRRPSTSPWVLGATWSYAQVAIAGRRFDDIRDDRDMNRPFRVVGNFTDDDLVHIVQLVRSDPPTRDPIRPWPILWVKRWPDDSVHVDLLEEVTHGQAIILRKSGQDWLIVTVTSWAA